MDPEDTSEFFKLCLSQFMHRVPENMLSDLSEQAKNSENTLLSLAAGSLVKTSLQNEQVRKAALEHFQSKKPLSPTHHQVLGKQVGLMTDFLLAEMNGPSEPRFILKGLKNGFRVYVNGYELFVDTQRPEHMEHLLILVAACRSLYTSTNFITHYNKKPKCDEKCAQFRQWELLLEEIEKNEMNVYKWFTPLSRWPSPCLDLLEFHHWGKYSENDEDICSFFDFEHS